MKNLLYVLTAVVLSLFSLPTRADVFNLSDAWAMGGNYNDYINDVAYDRSGNVYMSGTFSSNTIDLDPGNGFRYSTREGLDDLFIVKLDRSGKFLWAITYGTSQTESGTQIEVDKQNNILISGSYYGRMDLDPGPKQDLQGVNNVRSAFLVKLDSTGKYIWGHSFTASGATTMTELKIDEDNNIITSGQYSDNIDMDPGPNYTVLVVSNRSSNGIFLAKYDPDGEIIWAKGFNGSGFKIGEDIAVGKQNQIAMTGYFTGIIDVDPDARVENKYSVNKYDGFVLLVDSTGDLKWSGHYRGEGIAVGRAVAITDSGVVYCSGSFIDTVDIDPGFTKKEAMSPDYLDYFITKFTPSGNVVWTEAFGGERDDVISAIECKGETDLFLAGSFYSKIDLDPGTGVYELTGLINTAFVYRTDSALKPVDHAVFRSSGKSYSYEMNFNSSGDILVGGAFTNTIDLDPGEDTLSAPTEGGYDGFAAVLRTCDNRIVLNREVLPDTSAVCGFASAIAPTASSECVGELTATTSTRFPIEGKDTTIVTWVYDDGNGTTFEQMQRFIITDDEAPVPDLAELPRVESRCPILMANIPTATDNCGGRIIGKTSTVFPIKDEGVTTVTWTFTDAMGNGESMQQAYEITPYLLTYTQIGARLIADEPNAKYQWLDCNDRYATIDGATEREFTPTQNGRYAVRLSVGSCIELLECVEVENVGVREIGKAEIHVYPNPVLKNRIYVNGAEPVALHDLSGKAINIAIGVKESSFTEYVVSPKHKLPGGLYILTLSTEHGMERIRFSVH